MDKTTVNGSLPVTGTQINGVKEVFMGNVSVKV